VNSRCSKQKINEGSSLNPANCIPDSISAVNFAKLKWEEKFGKEIFDRGPFSAKMLNDSIWFVSSSEESVRNPGPKTINFGGILSIQIRKRDCEVLYINVTK
jgi:hypothetical protein